MPAGPPVFLPPRRFECLKVVHGHKRTVRYVFMDGMLFCTASTDETVCVWRLINKGERKFRRVDRVCKLRGHKCTVNVARFRSSDLVSGGADGRLISWDLRTEQPLRTFLVRALRWVCVLGVLRCCVAFRAGHV